MDSRLCGVPLVGPCPLDVQALGTDGAEAGIDALRNGEGTAAGATLVVMANLHMGEGFEVTVTGLAAEPSEAGDTGVTGGKAALTGELESSGLTDDDSDVGVGAIGEGRKFSVFRSGENGNEEDGSRPALFGSLARSLDAVGETTLGLTVEESHQRTASEEEGENGESGELVRVVHG